MDTRCFVFYAKPWEMEGRKGLSIEYLITDNLNPCEDMEGAKGVRHCKESVPIECQNRIKKIPGWYDLGYILKTGAKGKPQLKVNDLKYVCTHDGQK